MELERRERYHIDTLKPSLNCNIPTRTQKEYREAHKQELAQKSKKYREVHKQELAQKKKKYYEDNKEILNVKNKEYNEKNKTRLRAKKAERVICECGFNSSRTNLTRHRKSARHQKLLEGRSI
jgi:hypothetical protein